ncbi:MAG: hypothetical protein ABGZ53_14580 [Fuerstiella sp.]
MTTPAPLQHATTCCAHTDMRAAVRLVAETYYGNYGIWLCDAFEAINAEWFSGNLPYPHIVINITAHGRCLGLTHTPETRPPNITIHPTMFGLRSRGESSPWGLDPAWLGKRYVFDLLLHEIVHVQNRYVASAEDVKGPTSHNNDAWINEVNRLCPLIGLDGIKAARSVVRRVDGKPKRTTDGNIPFNVAATFPHSIRQHTGTADDYYRNGRLPLDV